jgi:hypothetical protein
MTHSGRRQSNSFALRNSYSISKMVAARSVFVRPSNHLLLFASDVIGVWILIVTGSVLLSGQLSYDLSIEAFFHDM